MADYSLEKFKQLIVEDMSLCKYQLIEALRDDTDQPEVHFACALKEARRLESDIYRMAKVAGVSREEIDKVRT